jgi:hypothetical protein
MLGITFKQCYLYSFIIFIIITSGPGSTNEQEHVIFGFLRMVYFTQYDDLQFHPFLREGLAARMGKGKEY